VVTNDQLQAIVESNGIAELLIVADRKVLAKEILRLRTEITNNERKTKWVDSRADGLRQVHQNSTKDQLLDAIALEKFNLMIALNLPEDKTLCTDFMEAIEALKRQAKGRTA